MPTHLDLRFVDLLAQLRALDGVMPAPMRSEGVAALQLVIDGLGSQLRGPTASEASLAEAAAPPVAAPIWQGWIAGGPTPDLQLNYSVTVEGPEILLRLKVRLPLPPGAQAQRPPLHARLAQELLSDVMVRARALLVECLRPTFGGSP